MSSVTARLIWHGRRFVRFVGWQGCAAAALLIAAGVSQFVVLAPVEREIADLRKDMLALHAKGGARTTLRAVDTPAEQLAQFYAFFPDGDGMNDVLTRVHKAAAAQNLVLEQAEFHLIQEADGKLQRYEMVFPVKGPYPQVRRFIARVLAENSSVALDGVGFSRQNLATIGVDAQVRMSLYLRAQP
jgi:hypothetical protein